MLCTLVQEMCAHHMHNVCVCGNVSDKGSQCSSCTSMHKMTSCWMHTNVADKLVLSYMTACVLMHMKLWDAESNQYLKVHILSIYIIHAFEHLCAWKLQVGEQLDQH